MSETNNSNEVVVSIKNLQKAFGDNVVLRDIDLDVRKGEVVVVLGPSGSGKSTMLRCINRLEEPTSGSIVVEGVDVCAKGVDLNKVRSICSRTCQSKRTSCLRSKRCSSAARKRPRRLPSRS